MKLFFLFLALIAISISYIVYMQNRFAADNQSAFEAIKMRASNEPQLITEKQIEHLPKSVRAWLKNTQLIGKQTKPYGKLKQSLKLKLKPDQENWMQGEATQITRLDQPEFVWQLKLDMLPMVKVFGRDQLEDGVGSMLIKPLGLFAAVNEHDHEAINEGALHRYLAELMWFPSGALSAYLKWEDVGAHQAKATINYKDMSVSGLFEFDDQGRVISFYTKRWRIDEGEAFKTGWRINVLSYHEKNHFPNKIEVIWELPQGDWKWLEVEVRR